MSPRGWSVALVAAVLLAAAAVPGAAVAQTPDQTINAQEHPEEAAAALNSGSAQTPSMNSGCADNINNCTLADISLTNGYSTPQILGDVLYNCAPPGGPDAYTGTSVSDTRGETTSLSESVSVTLQGGLIGVASASAEFKAFSSQSQGWTNTVTQSTSIPVPPGYKGYTTTQVPSVNAIAAYYVTDGIHLIDVTNVDLSYPYPDAGANGNGNNTLYNLITVPINPVINLNYQTIAPCNAVSDAPNTTVVGSVLGGARPKFAAGSFKLTLCQPGRRCVTHSLQGAPPPKVRRATAVLARGARTYAAGTDIGGHLRLTELRNITAGTYQLTIKQKPKRFKERRNGGLAEQRTVIRVPINVCGNSPSAGPRFGNPCTNAKT